jgi:hypothetical protein
MDVTSKICGKKEYCLNPLKNADGFLPLSEFYTDKHKTSGYRSECKKCCNKPPKLVATLKEDRNLKLIEDYKLGTKVSDLMVTFGIKESSIYRLLRAYKVNLRDTYENLMGKVFERLTVVGRTRLDGDTTRCWDCVCSCGKSLRVPTSHLISGHTKSCGCYSAEIASKRLLKHGQSVPGHVTNVYTMRRDAKARAIKQNVPFDLELEDIIILEFCPVLGIKLQQNKEKMGDDSPTLDKIIPELGYVRGNIAVISLKANRMKGAANLDEINKLANWVEKETTEDVATEEWKQMPEFIQNKQEAYAKIIVRLNSEEDLEDLSKRLGQNLTRKTKSIWHPKLVRGKDSDKRWVDES